MSSLRRCCFNSDDGSLPEDGGFEDSESRNGLEKSFHTNLSMIDQSIQTSNAQLIAFQKSVDTSTTINAKDLEKDMERINENQISDLLPRVIVSIDHKSRRIHAERKSFHTEVFALSHRWVSRRKDDIQTWTVQCGEDEVEYETKLYAHEISHLESYLKTLEQPLWVDYVCIDQSSDSDKNAQVSIMGSIYLNFTTLIVGNDLDPVPPAAEYFDRGWTFQERKFGRVHFPYDLKELDGENARLLGRQFGESIPELAFSLDKIYSPYDYNEGWRSTSANEYIQKLRDNGEDYKASLVEEAKKFMVESRQSDLAKIVLQYRSIYNYSYLPDDKAHFNGKAQYVVLFQTEMFRVNVSIPKDRLYGIWGVPMHMKNVKLDYEQPMEAWRKIVHSYPNANFAFYTMEKDPEQKHFLGFQSFADVETIVACLLSEGGKAGRENTQYIMNPKPAKVLETTTHPFPRDPHGLTFTLAWGEHCVGFACKKGCKEALSPEDGPFHFVVSYNVLKVTPDSEGRGDLNFRTTVGSAFDYLAKERLDKILGIETFWQLPYDIENLMAKTLRQMVQKHEEIAKYSQCFGFEELNSYY